MLVSWHKCEACRPAYLESRGLEPATIVGFSERIRTDERGNTLFRHDDLFGLSGWEIKNKGFSGFARGGNKAFFACRVGIQPEKEINRLVVAESAIDGMSFYQHDPTPALVLSFGGGLSPEQGELLHHVLTKYPAAEIVTATDNDPQGEVFAALIQSHRPDAVRARPIRGKDWNDSIAPP